MKKALFLLTLFFAFISMQALHNQLVNTMLNAPHMTQLQEKLHYEEDIHITTSRNNRTGYTEPHCSINPRNSEYRKQQ